MIAYCQTLKMYLWEFKWDLVMVLIFFRVFFLWEALNKNHWNLNQLLIWIVEFFQLKIKLIVSLINLLHQKIMHLFIIIIGLFAKILELVYQKIKKYKKLRLKKLKLKNKIYLKEKLICFKLIKIDSLKITMKK